MSPNLVPCWIRDPHDGSGYQTFYNRPSSPLNPAAQRGRPTTDHPGAASALEVSENKGPPHPLSGDLSGVGPEAAAL
jgi:hypothetical protein